MSTTTREQAEQLVRKLSSDVEVNYFIRVDYTEAVLRDVEQATWERAVRLGESPSAKRIIGLAIQTGDPLRMLESVLAQYNMLRDELARKAKEVSDEI